MCNHLLYKNNFSHKAIKYQFYDRAFTNLSHTYRWQLRISLRPPSRVIPNILSFWHLVWKRCFSSSTSQGLAKLRSACGNVLGKTLLVQCFLILSRAKRERRKRAFLPMRQKYIEQNFKICSPPRTQVCFPNKFLACSKARRSCWPQSSCNKH